MRFVSRRLIAIYLLLISLISSSAQEKPAPAKPPMAQAAGALPAGAITRIGGNQLSHGGLAIVVAYGPDGKTIASGGGDRLVRLWNVATGEEIRQFAGHSGNVDTVAYSPDGKTLASGSADNTIRLWDAASGAVKSVLKGSGGGVNTVAFSPDGKTLASKGHDSSVRLWDVATGMERLRMPCAADSGTSNLAWAPDGKHVLAVSEDNTLRLWDAANGKEVRRYTGHQQGVHSLDVSRDGKWIASASVDSTVRLWEFATGKEVRQFTGHTDLVSGVRLSPDGKTLASCAADRTIRLWEVATGKEIRQLTGHVALVSEISFSPDGQTLASACWDYTVRLWDLATGKELLTNRSDGGPVVCATLSLDGQTVIAGHRDGRVRFWDASKGRLVRRLAQESFGINCVAVSNAGDLVAVRTVDGGVHVYEAATGKLRASPTLSKLTAVGGLRMPRAADLPQSMAFSPDAKMLAVIEANGAVSIWDPQSGKSLSTLLPAERGAIRLAFSPDGRQLATVGRDGTVRLWAPGSWREIRQLVEATRGALINAATFAPDGRTLVTWTQTGSLLRTWELATGLSRRQTIVVERNPMFSPCGTLLATGASTGLRLRDALTQKDVKLLNVTGSLVTSHSFSATPRRLVSVAADGTALVWDLSSLSTTGPTTVVKLTPAQTNDAWAALAGADAIKAGQAIVTLLSGGDATAIMARERISRGTVMDPKRIVQLVAQLDDDDFTIRERASEELERAGSQAEGPLRAVLTGEPSAEHLRRAGELLKKIEGGSVAGERLRTIRALEILENLDGTEAHKTLEGLASGPAKDWLTDEAKVVLERRGRRPGR